MDLSHAIFLALVQGLTEFLPISSSAHLILLPRLAGWVDQGLAFDVAVHVGTLMAVLTYLRRDVWTIASAWFAGWPSRKWDEQGTLGWLMVLATIPLGIVGLAANGRIEETLRDPLIIATVSLVFGLLLGWADRRGGRQVRSVSDMSWRDALYIGCAQALAVIPGTSRSGVTMTMGLMLGMSRTEASRFSFLLAIPAIALPGMLKAWELANSEAMIDWLALAVGVAVSAVTAFLCIDYFMRFVARVGMKPFVIYRVLLSIVLFLVFFPG